MNRILIALTALLLIVALAGCAGNTPRETPPPENATWVHTYTSEYRQPRGSEVFFTADISAEGLVRVYQALGIEPQGSVAVKITGPATKITNLGAAKSILGIKHFALYLLYSVVFALAAGLLVDTIF